MGDTFQTWNPGSGTVVNKPEIQGDLVINPQRDSEHEPDYEMIIEKLLSLLSEKEKDLSELEKTIIIEAKGAAEQQDKAGLRIKMELLAKSTLGFIKEIAANVIAALVTGNK